MSSLLSSVPVPFLSHRPVPFLFFFFNATPTTEIYTLSLHDALPISYRVLPAPIALGFRHTHRRARAHHAQKAAPRDPDRKSTRLNSSHRCISYAVFCLKKKKTKTQTKSRQTNTSV